MERDSSIYKEYLCILERELVPALGCTEPIAIAYAAALAAEVLGKRPDTIRVEASGNIIKNVKSVIVPGTGGMKGIQTAAAAGIIAGSPQRKLELLEELDAADRQAIREYMENTEIRIEKAGGSRTFDLTVTVWAKEEEAKVRIADSHTNVVRIEKDGQILRGEETPGPETEPEEGTSPLSMEGIVDFAMTADTADVKELLERQIRYNMAIAEEGMKNDYGANVGKVLLAAYGDDVKIRARAKAAAGSDARMNGCELPVVINSGSGNQGITVSVPVIEYAAELEAGREKLYR
ncbi:L-serine ammonia-lyase, iron-sulfur-dependent, subunit alpha, partial [Eisenbergiella sp.]